MLIHTSLVPVCVVSKHFIHLDTHLDGILVSQDGMLHRCLPDGFALSIRVVRGGILVSLVDKHSELCFHMLSKCSRYR